MTCWSNLQWQCLVLLKYGTLLLVCRRSSNYLMKRIFLGFFLKNFINRFGSEHIFELLVWSTTPDLTKRRFILWYFQHYNEHREKADHFVKSVQIRSFFWSVFSCTWTEYGEILPVSPYSVWMQEHADQKKLCIWTLFTQWISCYWESRKLTHDSRRLLRVSWELASLQAGACDIITSRSRDKLKTSLPECLW